MKVAILLFISASCSVCLAGKLEMRVEVLEDEFLRPTKIIRYYVDGAGKRVLHGENITYDWSIGLRSVVAYRDGSPGRMQIGEFNGRGRGVPYFSDEAWRAKSSAERANALKAWPVPLPPSTPFEEKWADRQEYLEGYKAGYRAALAGSKEPDLSENRKPDSVRAEGFSEGQKAAFHNHPRIRGGLPPAAPR